MNKKLFIIVLFTISCWGKDYLVVTHEDLYSTTWYNTFSALKTDYGYTMHCLQVPDGTSINSLASTIATYTPVPDAILLVGDASNYPTAQRETAYASNGNYMPFGYEQMDVYLGWSGSRTWDIASDKTIKDAFESAHGSKPVLGRVPAGSVTEMTNWVNKLSTYCTFTANSGYRDNVLLLSDNKDHPSNGGSHWLATKDRDQMLNDYLNESGYDVTQLNSYDYSGGYYDNKSTRAGDFEDEVNAGTALIYAHGVGASEYWLNNFYWASANPNDQPGWDFNNSAKYPFLMGMSCSLGKIQNADPNNNYAETPSVLEKLLFLENAGIIGAFAPTEDTFSYTLRIIFTSFWDHFVNDHYNNFYSLTQDALDDMKDFFNTNPVYYEGRWVDNSDYGTREWEYRSYIYYGDPTLPISTTQFPTNDITSNTTWKGEIVLKSNITVPSGVTLTIEPGTTIRFDGYYSLTISDGAKLDAQGTDSKPILFTSVSGTSPQSWNKIYLRSDDNIMKWCEIEYGNWAVHAYGSPSENNTFENCIFHDNDQGLRIENNEAKIIESSIYSNRHNIVSISNSKTYIEATSISGGGRDGIYSTSGDYLQLYGNVIEDNGAGGTSTRNGIYAGYNDVISLGHPQAQNGEAYNTIRDNYASEIYAYSGSQASIYYNSIHDDAGYEIDNHSGSAFSTSYCWWGEYPPSGGQTFGSVGLNRPLKEEPDWEGQAVVYQGGLPKIAENPEHPSVGDRIRQLKQFLIEDPTSPDADNALAELFMLLREDYFDNRHNERGLFYAFLARLNAGHPNSNMGVRAVKYMIVWKSLEGRYNQAITLSNILLDRLYGTERMAVTSNLIYLYAENEQFDLAWDLFNTYQEQFGDLVDDLSFLEESIAELEETATGEVNRQSNPQNEPNEPTPTIISGSAAPNPFNPTTVIRYSVPARSRVNITIYNIAGQKVTTLVDAISAPGVYSQQYDGSNLSSGVYFCRIETGRKSVVLKLQVIK